MVAEPSAKPARRPGMRDRYIRRNRTANLIYRLGVAVVGSVIIIAGIVLLPLPGPGWLIIFLGLGVLATEFAWAERLLVFAKRHVLAWTHWLQRQPLLVRLAVGLGCVLIVVGAIAGYLWLMGVPGWVPSWVPWIG